MTQAYKTLNRIVRSASPAQTPHVLFIIDGLWGIAGAEGALLRNVRLLPQRGFRCSVVTFRLRPGHDWTEEFGCPVYEFPVSGMFTAGAWRAAVELRRLIRREQVDIVHTFFETSDFLGGLTAKFSRTPVLVSSRRDMGILRSPRHRLAYFLLRPVFDQVQAVSESVRDYAIAAEGLDPLNTVVVGNGVELDLIDAAGVLGADFRPVPLPDGARVIATVSHVRRVKGLDVLMHAASQVCRLHPEAVFLIIGGIHEPAYLAELERLKQALGLAGHVYFLGKQEQSQLWRILKGSYAFCLLSRSEGMSNALLEAMGCALPCIASAVGGNPEVIADGQSGYLVPAGDAAAAAQRILQLLDSPDLACRLGRTGRALVAHQFSAEHQVDKLAGFYRRLLHSHDQGK